MNTLTRISLPLLTCLTLQTAALAQTILAKDSLKPTDARPVGTLLAGTHPQEGTHADKLWILPSGPKAEDSPGPAIAESGIIAAGKPTEARIQIASPSERLTVSADIVTKGSEWVGLGFTKNHQWGFLYHGGNGQLWVGLRPGGAATLYYNGNKVLVSKKWADAFQPKLGAYDSGKAWTVTLTYDPAAATAEVSIGDGSVSVPLTAEAVDLAGKVRSTDINAVAVRFHGAGNEAAVSNFLLTSGKTEPNK